MIIIADTHKQANKLVDLIWTSLEKFFPTYIKTGKLNYIQEGYVTEIVDANTVMVSINGSIKTIPVANSLSLIVNDIVFILMINYDKNRRLVIAKKPSNW